MRENAFERTYLAVLYLLGERIVPEQEPYRRLSCRALVQALGAAERRAGVSLILPEVMRLTQGIEALGLR